MSTVEQKISNLERELKAMKVAFERSATKTNLITKPISFNTKENLITLSGQYPFSQDDLERVVVTLSTSSGANTIAKLEISGNYDTLPTVRRVPFSGGARWVVTNSPRQSGGSWTPTTYNFTVHSLVNGTINAGMIWEVS